MNFSRLPIMASAMSVSVLAACQLDGQDEDLPGSETSSTIAALSAADTCAWAPTVTVTPAVIPPMPVGVPVVLDVAITNPNPASCEPLPFEIDILNSGLLFDPRPAPTIIFPGLRITPPPVLTIASGATGHLAVTATAPASADGGDVLQVSIVIADPSPPPPPPAIPSRVIVPSIPFTVAREPGCQVSAAHELMITNVSVVDDPVRTVFDASSRDRRNGVWTFKHLAEAMARTPRDAPAMVEAMLTSFTAPQTVNGFRVAARPGIQSQVLASWPRTSDGGLDLAQAPLRLQAIVNRFDLRDLTSGDAGEGRFVFAFNLPGPVPGAPPPQATIIFEYKLPAARDLDVILWAEAFHALGRLPFGEAYNAVLQAITERFVRRGARPGHPNASAINAVRTNEIPFGDNRLWELREFHLSAISGRLEPATLELTPDFGFNQSSALAAYINANQPRIIAETQPMPDILDGQPFKAGAVFNDLRTWFAPGVDPEARHHFAINTCNGCHSAQETGTGFLHIVPRPPGREAQRSSWLTGTVIDDPVTGSPRNFDDLARRKADLKAIVCRGSAAVPGDQLRKGISRVH
jgi:hypothetical protein